MKKRSILLALCLALLFSTLSPAAFAADLDTPVDDPVDPDPYLYIHTIDIDLDIASSGAASCYASAFVPDTTKTVYVTIWLQRRALDSTSASDFTTYRGPWSDSGTYTVTVDKLTYVTRGYTYRLLVGVDVYSGNILVDTTSAESDYFDFT